MTDLALQLTIDCAKPDRLARFWSLALHWQLEPPPGGASTWTEYWRSVGVPEDELDPDDDGFESIVDPTGRGPRIWFQQVPEAKSVKNRLHLDLKVGGGRSVLLADRRLRVDAEVARLVEAGATTLYVSDAPDQNHYAVTLADPEGNEFCVV
ncbi:MAG: VOC family protein [Actinobacteria bacterium]|nr:VOC family protein [Actinomycetota bacterium]